MYNTLRGAALGITTQEWNEKTGGDLHAVMAPRARRTDGSPIPQ